MNNFESIDSYIQAMKDQIDSRPALQTECGLSGDNETWLREFKTIGYRCPRQCGSQFWMHKDFLKGDDSLIIVPDTSEKDRIRDSFTRNREYIGMGDNPAGIEIGLDTTVANRILTYKDVKANHMNMAHWIGTGNTPLLHKDIMKITRVYVTNSHKLFRNIKRADFYDWLATMVLTEKGWVILNDMA